MAPSTKCAAPLPSASTSRSPNVVGNPDESARPDATGNDAVAQTDFGRLGISLFILTWMCIGWTVWLVSLSVNPSDAVAQIMRTEDFDHDDGVYGGASLSVWEIVDPNASAQVLGVVGFSLILLGYVFVALKLTVWQQLSRVWSPPEPAGKDSQKSLDKVVAVMAQRPETQVSESFATVRRRSISRSSSRVMKELAQVETSLLKNKNLRMKALDLTVQLAMLIQILDRGLPVELVWIFVVCLVLSSGFCAMVIHSTRDRWVLGIALMDALFDLFNAIIFPMIVLSYSVGSFHFGRAQLDMNVEIFPAGSFERLASGFVDRTQLELLRRCFNALRITSALDFVAKVALNVLLCCRAVHVTDLIRHVKTRKGRLYPKRHPIALPFLFFALLTVIFVIVSVHTSKQACESHPECAVHAHRWVNLNNGELNKCPCLALVDIETAPTRYAEWVQPQNDVTEKVHYLAATGHLESIHLVNRFLPALPEQLKHCKKLRSLSLIYTDTTTLPTWTKEFTKLELIHIEGKTGVSGLLALPEDLFAKMNRLVLLHLGSHQNLTHLPPFAGLTNLQTLVLEELPSLQTLPSLHALHKLEQLHLTAVPRLARLPDLAAIRGSVRSFTLSGRSPMCCNGFLQEEQGGGEKTCDLSHAYCAQNATCIAANDTANLATEATRSVFATFASSVCQLPSNSSIASAYEEEELVLTETNVNRCNGALYKACNVSSSGMGDRAGMCYNPRMKIVHCSGSALAIAMRKRQIAESVGDACDPEVEAWLGCE